MVLGRIKSPFSSNLCIFQSVPNKEDQRRVKLTLTPIISVLAEQNGLKKFRTSKLEHHQLMQKGMS